MGETKVAIYSGKGSRPGERRGGRKKGTPNKSTADIRDLMRNYTAAAAAELARLAVEAESEAARVAAIKEIFDRAYGKSAQPHVGDDDLPPIQTVARIELVAVPVK